MFYLLLLLVVQVQAACPDASLPTMVSDTTFNVGDLLKGQSYAGGVMSNLWCLTGVAGFTSYDQADMQIYLNGAYGESLVVYVWVAQVPSGDSSFTRTIGVTFTDARGQVDVVVTVNFRKCFSDSEPLALTQQFKCYPVASTFSFDAGFQTYCEYTSFTTGDTLDFGADLSSAGLFTATVSSNSMSADSTNTFTVSNTKNARSVTVSYIFCKMTISPSTSALTYDVYEIPVSASFQYTVSVSDGNCDQPFVSAYDLDQAWFAPTTSENFSWKNTMVTISAGLSEVGSLTSTVLTLSSLEKYELETTITIDYRLCEFSAVPMSQIYDVFLTAVAATFGISGLFQVPDGCSTSDFVLASLPTGWSFDGSAKTVTISMDRDSLTVIPTTVSVSVTTARTSKSASLEIQYVDSCTETVGADFTGVYLVYPIAQTSPFVLNAFTVNTPSHCTFEIYSFTSNMDSITSFAGLSLSITTNTLPAEPLVGQLTNTAYFSSEQEGVTITFAACHTFSGSQSFEYLVYPNSVSSSFTLDPFVNDDATCVVPSYTLSTPFPGQSSFTSSSRVLVISTSTVPVDETNFSFLKTSYVPIGKEVAVTYRDCVTLGSNLGVDSSLTTNLKLTAAVITETVNFSDMLSAIVCPAFTIELESAPTHTYSISDFSVLLTVTLNTLTKPALTLFQTRVNLKQSGNIVNYRNWVVNYIPCIIKTKTSATLVYVIHTNKQTSGLNLLDYSLNDNEQCPVTVTLKYGSITYGNANWNPPMTITFDANSLLFSIYHDINSDKGDYTFTLIAENTENQVQVDFVVRMTASCLPFAVNLAPSLPTAITYKINTGENSAQSLEFFTSTDSECRVFTITVSSVAALVVGTTAGVSQFSVANQNLFVDLRSNDLAGSYQVTAVGTNTDGNSNSFTFTLTVELDCTYPATSISVQTAVSDLTYEIYSGVLQKAFAFQASYSDCDQFLAYQLLTQTDATPDFIVRLNGFFFKVETNDNTKVAAISPYPLRIYATLPLTQSSDSPHFDFSLTLQANCKSTIARVLTTTRTIEIQLSSSQSDFDNFFQQGTPVFRGVENYGSDTEIDPSTVCLVTGFTLSDPLVLPSWMSEAISSEQRITVLSTVTNEDVNQLPEGIFTLKVTGQIGSASTAVEDITFKLTPDCSVVTPSAPETIRRVYKIKDASTTFDIPSFAPVIHLCPITRHSYALDLQQSDGTWVSVSDVNNPGFTFTDTWQNNPDPTAVNEFVIYQANNKYAANNPSVYRVTVTAYNKADSSADVSFEVEMQLNCETSISITSETTPPIDDLSGFVKADVLTVTWAAFSSDDSQSGETSYCEVCYKLMNADNTLAYDQVPSNPIKSFDPVSRTLEIYAAQNQQGIEWSFTLVGFHDGGVSSAYTFTIDLKPRCYEEQVFPSSIPNMERFVLVTANDYIFTKFTTSFFRCKIDYYEMSFLQNDPSAITFIEKGIVIDPAVLFAKLISFTGSTLTIQALSVNDNNFAGTFKFQIKAFMEVTAGKTVPEGTATFEYHLFQDCRLAKLTITTTPVYTLADYYITNPDQLTPIDKTFAYTQTEATTVGCPYVKELKQNGFSTSNLAVSLDEVLFRRVDTTVTNLVVGAAASTNNAVYVGNTKQYQTYEISILYKTVNGTILTQNVPIKIYHECMLAVFSHDASTPNQDALTYQISRPSQTVAVYTVLIDDTKFSIAKCGLKAYSIKNDDGSTLNNLIFTTRKMGSDPLQISTFTMDPNDADRDEDPPFQHERLYGMTITVALGIYGVHTVPITFRIIDPCLSLKLDFLDIFSISPNKYYVMQPTLKVSLPQFLVNIPVSSNSAGDITFTTDQSGNLCGEVSYEISNFDPKIFNLQITETDLYFNVFADSNKYARVYQIQQLVKMTRATEIYLQQTHVFNFTILDCKIDQVQTPRYINGTFVVQSGNLPEFVDFYPFVQVPACNYTFSYVVITEDRIASELAKTNPANKTLNFLQDFTWKKKEPTMRLYNLDTKWIDKTFLLKVSALVEDPYRNIYFSSPSFSVYIANFVLVIQNSPPVFKPSLINFSFVPGDSYLIKTKPPIDYEYNTILIDDVKIQPSAPWITIFVEEEGLKFDIVKIPKSAAGITFQVSIHMLDDFPGEPMQSTTTFDIKVKGSKAYDQRDSFIGVVEVDEVENKKYVEPPSYTLSPLDANDDIVLTFSEPVTVSEEFVRSDEPIHTWNSLTGNFTDVFEMKVVFSSSRRNQFDSNRMDQSNFDFYWNVTQFLPTEKKLIIHVTFLNKQFVSSGGIVDKIQVSLKKPDLFQSTTSGFVLVTQAEPDIFLIPASDSYTVITTNAVASLGGAVNSLFGANFAVNFLLSGSLSYLWGLINSLQIAVYTILFNIHTPSNCYTVMKELISLSSFDFLNTNEFQDYLFKYSESNTQMEPYNDNFSNAGMETSVFTLNLGTFFVIAFVFFTMIPLRICCDRQLRNRKGRCAEILRKFFGEYQYKVEIVRFFLEAHLEFGISGLISVWTFGKESWSYKQDIFSNSLAVVCLASVVVLPLVMSRIGVKRARHCKKLKSEQEKAQVVLFGSKRASAKVTLEEVKKEQKSESVEELFEGLKTTQAASQFHTVFLLRRLVLIGAIMFFRSPDLAAFQIILNIQSSLFAFSFVAIVQPREKALDAKLEILNDFLIVVIQYHAFAFTDWLNGEPLQVIKVQDNLGWSMVGFVTAIMGINMGVMICFQFLTFKRFLRIRRLKKTQQIMIQRREEQKIDRQINLIREARENIAVRNDALQRNLEMHAPQLLGQSSAEAHFQFEELQLSNNLIPVKSKPFKNRLKTKVASLHAQISQADRDFHLKRAKQVLLDYWEEEKEAKRLEIRLSNSNPEYLGDFVYNSKDVPTLPEPVEIYDREKMTYFELEVTKLVETFPAQFAKLNGTQMRLLLDHGMPISEIERQVRSGQFVRLSKRLEEHAYSMDLAESAQNSARSKSRNESTTLVSSGRSVAQRPKNRFDYELGKVLKRDIPNQSVHQLFNDEDLMQQPYGQQPGKSLHLLEPRSTFEPRRVSEVQEENRKKLLASFALFDQM